MFSTYENLENDEDIFPRRANSVAEETFISCRSRISNIHEDCRKENESMRRKIDNLKDTVVNLEYGNRKLKDCNSELKVHSDISKEILKMSKEHRKELAKQKKYYEKMLSSAEFKVADQKKRIDNQIEKIEKLTKDLKMMPLKMRTKMIKAIQHVPIGNQLPRPSIKRPIFEPGPNDDRIRWNLNGGNRIPLRSSNLENGNRIMPRSSNFENVRNLEKMPTQQGSNEDESDPVSKYRRLFHDNQATVREQQKEIERLNREINIIPIKVRAEIITKLNRNS